jgi:hypothetical protein
MLEAEGVKKRLLRGVRSVLLEERIAEKRVEEEVLRWGKSDMAGL